MGRYLVDSSTFPVVMVTFDGALSDEGFAEYLAELRHVLDRGSRYGVVFDATNAAVPSTSQRRMQADYIRSERERLKRMCVGAAFVIPNALVRGSLTAILWLQPLPYEHTVVASVSAAREWVQGRLAATVM